MRDQIDYLSRLPLLQGVIAMEDEHYDGDDQKLFSRVQKVLRDGALFTVRYNGAGPGRLSVIVLDGDNFHSYATIEKRVEDRFASAEELPAEISHSSNSCTADTLAASLPALALAVEIGRMLDLVFPKNVADRAAHAI